MAKRFFGTTDETRAVLLGNEAAIAKAKGCDPSYIYNIKNSEEPDPYPPFREWFQFCALGGGNVRSYLHDLEGIACQAESSRFKSLSELLVKKIDADAESSHVLAEANADGQWDARECERILTECDRVDCETRKIRDAALARKAELTGVFDVRQYAKKAVASHGGGKRG
jgi:hypothetical protein